MTIILFRKTFHTSVGVLSLLALSAASQAWGAIANTEAVGVFMNEGRAKIQVNVISEDRKDRTILPLRPGAIERTLYSGGQVELYTSSKDLISGRLLFTRSLPTPISASGFMEKGTRTFYFRVVDGKIILVKSSDLTPKERKWLKEKLKSGW
jgi:hypothetical protein